MSPIRFEAAAESQHVHDEKPRQWAMVIDLRKCDGCKKCTEACRGRVSSARTRHA
jgi:Fe-S-cluster-containing dehydrogenase component